MTNTGTAHAEHGAVFVMPRPGTEWASAAALWITVAGWASAARALLGGAWVATPSGVVSPEEVLEYTRPRVASAGPSRKPVRVPEVVRTALKDSRRMHVMRSYRDVGEQAAWRDAELAFVWQHHDLFHRAGAPLARRRGCPLVSYVHAPQVWEAAQWGVRRPGWGTLLERHAERPQLLESDVVAVVSEEVAAEVVRLGVDERRVLVSPMAVDAERFAPGSAGADVRARFGLDGAFVVGWTGSFRKFHGLDAAIDAFAQLLHTAPGSRLLLVGDGAERSQLERQARTLGIGDAVVFAGAVAHEDLPALLGAMDVTVVTARAGEGFHYSPLKMREYLAAACPVVAPNVGDIGRTVTDGVDGLLYEAGDVTGLARCLNSLHADADLRASVGAAGRTLMLEHGTWKVQLDRLLASAPYRKACNRLGFDPDLP